MPETRSHQETNGNRQGFLDGNNVTTKKQTGEVADHRSRVGKEGRTPAYTLKPFDHAMAVIMENAYCSHHPGLDQRQTRPCDGKP
jgi:hypothetical protein